MAGTRSSSTVRSTGATRQRVSSSTRDATPTRTSARQREKKKAKSGDVLTTVAEDNVVVDVDEVNGVVDFDVADDDDIAPPPLVERTNVTTDNTFPSDSAAAASNVASDGR